MLKKAIALTSLVATGLTFATAAPMMAAQTNPFNGFYIGAGAGVANVGYKQRINAFDGLFDENNVQGTKTGPFAQLNLGYDYAINNWTIGAQLFGNLSNIQSRQNMQLTIDDDGEIVTANATSKLITQYEYGVALRGGYQWRSNLFYLMAGPEMARFKTESYESDTEDGPTPTMTTHNNQAGLLVGGGVEQALTDHLRLTEQVTYSMYRGFSIADTTYTDTTISYTSLRKLGGMLGLAYQF